MGYFFTPHSRYLLDYANSSPQEHRNALLLVFNFLKETLTSFIFYELDRKNGDSEQSIDKDDSATARFYGSYTALNKKSREELGTKMTSN